MRNIPVFDSKWGVASLVLNQIPYTGNAYIRIYSSQDPDAFLQECISFCRACGAEQIYATGHEVCYDYPWHTDILKMQICFADLTAAVASLFPVTEQTAERWQQIYNDKIRSVPNGAWMTREDVSLMLQKGDGYFIHKDEILLGIGRASVDHIDWVASLQPGAGETVVKTLAHALCADTVYIEVATANLKALHLYERLNFVASQLISSWYKVYPK